MFAPIGRRLALLNALVVVGIVAAVALVIALALRVELDRQESRSLHRRAEFAATAWLPTIDPGAGSPAANPDASQDAGEMETGSELAAHEALEGGDAVLYGVDRNGQLIVNERGFAFSGLPDQPGIARALAGQTDERVVSIGGDTIRLVSVPIRDANGAVVGAVQAARGQTGFQTQLRIAIYTSLVGAALGAVIAPLTGLFLARRAVRPIDAAFAAQRAFVADASHELRTPLTVLRANAELLVRVPDLSATEVRAEAQNIVDEVDELARLVDDLLFLARADEHRARLVTREPVDLARIVAKEVSAYQNRASAAGLTMTARGAIPVEICGDADLVRQLLRNLIDNAIRYTQPGGVIAIETSIADNEGLLSVADTGPGIAERDLARIFDRFYRTADGRAQSNGGNGLGLAIAKSIAEQHGGTIGVTSKPGSGTTFTVRFPR